MNEKLTQEQLTQIVAEVEHLAIRREEELDKQQVKEILSELNLPPELLDEAMIQLQRREALAIQKRRNRWIAAGVGVALIGAIASSTLFFQHQQQLVAAVSSNSSRLTLSQDDGGNLTAIKRQDSPEVYYRVTLQAAPQGKKLYLRCDWINPSGQIAHQNSYQTRKIDKEVWTTYCRYRFGTATPAGIWQVRMFLGDRSLNSTSFTVN